MRDVINFKYRGSDTFDVDTPINAWRFGTSRITDSFTLTESDTVYGNTFYNHRTELYEEEGEPISELELFCATSVKNGADLMLERDPREPALEIE